TPTAFVTFSSQFPSDPLSILAADVPRPTATGRRCDMLEMDWLPVGDGERSGDAITARFTRLDTGALAHIVVDAGFNDDGKDVVAVFDRYYGTRKVDIAILTHPDG